MSTVPPSGACAEHEIAIDKRLHGVLSGDEARDLDAHLATCAGCRAYDASARGTQGDLALAAREVRAQVDWAAVERTVHATLRARRRKLAFAASLGVVAAFVATWGLSPPGHVLVFGLGVTVLVAAIVATRVVVVLREVRGIARLAAGDELLARHRAMLASRIVKLARLRWVAGGVALWCLGSAALAGEPRAAVTYVVLAAVVAAPWLHTLVLELPRLRRELADLDRVR